jgi:hypothetical protein
MKYSPNTARDSPILEYHFEGGGCAKLVASGSVATMDVLDAIERMIRLKRKELKAKEHDHSA